MPYIFRPSLHVGLSIKFSPRGPGFAGSNTAKVSGFFLTPWLMEPGDSMPHSQGLPNNSYPEPNQPNSNIVLP